MVVRNTIAGAVAAWPKKCAIIRTLRHDAKYFSFKAVNMGYGYSIDMAMDMGEETHG